MTPAGLFWGLFSALTYALYIILPIKLIQKWGSILVIGVGMTISGLVAVPFTGIIGASLPMSFDIFLAFAGIILIGTVLPTRPFLRGQVWLDQSNLVSWPLLSQSLRYFLPS